MEPAQIIYAERSQRFIAYLIDIFPILILVLGIFLIFFGFDDILDNYLNRGENIQPRIEFIFMRNLIRDISFVIWMFYCVLMEASEKQGTFGKSLMGIKVINQFGNRMTIRQSIQRNLSKLISYTILSLGFVWILFDKKRQGWHDKLGKTYVVKKEE